MYLTIRSYTGQEFADELATREDGIRGIITPIAGFRAYYLVHTHDGNAVTISIFDDEAGAEESTRAAAAWVAENMADFHPSPPQVTTGEVAFSL